MLNNNFQIENFIIKEEPYESSSVNQEIAPNINQKEKKEDLVEKDINKSNSNKDSNFIIKEEDPLKSDNKTRNSEFSQDNFNVSLFLKEEATTFDIKKNKLSDEAEHNSNTEEQSVKKFNGVLLNQKRDRVEEVNEKKVANKNKITKEVQKTNPSFINREHLQIVQDVMDERDGNFKAICYVINCANCHKEINNIKDLQMNFLFFCNACLNLNEYYFTKLLINFPKKKNKQDLNCSESFKFYFCSYCLLIDKPQNLITCKSFLCTNYFHKNCFDLITELELIGNFKDLNIKDIADNIFNLISNNSNVAYQQEKTENNDDDRLFTKIFRLNMNLLYKNFISVFCKYILKIPNKNSLQFDKKSSYCKSHICFKCSKEIDEFSKDEKSSNQCCSIYHNKCLSNQTKNKISNLNLKNKYHSPFLHFDFFKIIYFKTKNLIKSKFSNKILQSFPVELSPNESLITYYRLDIKQAKETTKFYKEISKSIGKQLLKNEVVKLNDKCTCHEVFISSNSNNSIDKILLKECNNYNKTNGYLCGINCQNRILKIECFEKTCNIPVEFCSNRYASIGQIYEHLEVVKTINRGYGLVTNVDIKKGQYIGEYIGIIKTLDDVKKEIQERPAWYVMSITKDLCIDAEFNGNKTRFINHSCDPNLIVEKFIGSGGYPRLLLFAKNEIKKDTELSYNYKFHYLDEGSKLKCLCGSKNCSNQMEGSSSNYKKTKLSSGTNKQSLTSLEIVVDSNNKNFPIQKISENFNFVLDLNTKNENNIYQLPFLKRNLLEISSERGSTELKVKNRKLLMYNYAKGEQTFKNSFKHSSNEINYEFKIFAKENDKYFKAVFYEFHITKETAENIKRKTNILIETYDKVGYYLIFLNKIQKMFNELIDKIIHK